ncbi:hypothetical protein FE782_01950 [Paenibacillus antri]|uniref:RelA/SpoT domain-containing protein n=1 Tax=Paenibacillus antri TaxID=2582848 RepID=A0A5R9GLU6_9BACL|nr:RelA/SpoT domain-containing protein [Paenibacillus antri]TLS54133.1 hypothetical protein FE782_01950 [Paenibacillus antri]
MQLLQLPPDSLLKDVEVQIKNELDKIGLFYRIFSRVKTTESLLYKMEEKEYGPDKKLQDLFGVRIVLYFNDDIEICETVVTRKFQKIDESRDHPDSSTFKPTRTNLIFRLDEKTSNLIEPVTRKHFIDNTFELQLRTVFSEGWHEVEHDLRYKCKEEWEGYVDHSRTLNGLVATLETCDWSIVQLFTELSYRNYKDNNLIPMIRNKFRLRFANKPLDHDMEEVLKSDKELVKKLYRVDRDTVLFTLSKISISLPLTFDNIIYICNYLFMKNEEILELTPLILKEQLAKILVVDH